MNTIFDVPCPECGRALSIADGGRLECPPCRRTYEFRMGHLFPVTLRPTTSIAAPAGRRTTAAHS